MSIIIKGLKTAGQVASKATGADNTWMLKKSAEFMKLNSDNTAQISQELDPAEYLNNPGFVSGKDPDTYVNKKKDFIEETLSHGQFLPPTTAAKTMWETYMHATKRKELAGGIAIEARTRVNARHQEINTGVELMINTLAEDPTREKFNHMIENVDLYVGTIDTEPGAEQYLAPGATNYLARTAKKNLANTYLSEYSKTNPEIVLDDIHNNTPYWKSLGLSEGDLILQHTEAVKNYKTLAEKDVLTIISMLRDNFDQILNNGGNITVTQLANFTPGDFTQDEFVMKLGMLLPWYQRNLQDGATRTKDNESQLTATYEDNGIWYLVPTIRWNDDGTQMMELNRDNEFDYAIDQGDALVVKDNAQGIRISNYMSRTLE